MQDCKPHLNAGFVSDLQFMRSAAASPQCPPWNNNYAGGGDVKNHRFILPSQNHAQSLQNASCMPQGYTHGSPWIDTPSPVPFSEHEIQATTQAFAVDMPTPMFPGRMFHWPGQHFEPPLSQVCPAYLTAQIPQPQFEDLSAAGLYTPSILSHTPPADLQHNPYLNGAYYCQPSGAQTFASPMPSPQINMPANLNGNLSFTPCTTTGPPEQCLYTIDPSIYRHHPEPGNSSDQHPHFRHGGPDTQAPGRVERGFTGHGSGVGGGAHT
jgi:hypothetical protein